MIIWRPTQVKNLSSVIFAKDLLCNLLPLKPTGGPTDPHKQKTFQVWYLSYIFCAICYSSLSLEDPHRWKNIQVKSLKKIVNTFLLGGMLSPNYQRKCSKWDNLAKKVSIAPLTMKRENEKFMTLVAGWEMRMDSHEHFSWSCIQVQNKN